MPMSKMRRSKLKIKIPDELTEIVPRLYLGDKVASIAVQELKEKRVTGIVNCTKTLDNFFPDKFNYFNIKIYDSESAAEEIYEAFRPAAEFIHQHISIGEGVLVHCSMGMSRSPSICVAYLMLYQNMMLHQALKTMRQVRFIYPRYAFIRGLQRLELEIYQESSSSLLQSEDTIELPFVVRSENDTEEKQME